MRIQNQKGVVALICSDSDQHDQPFKIVLNPVLIRINVDVGDSVRMHGIIQ